MAKRKYNYIDSDVASENPERYFAVFEEMISLEGKEKPYDLCLGIFESLEEAKAFADDIFRCEPTFVTDYASYIDGDYTYLYEVYGDEESED